MQAGQLEIRPYHVWSLSSPTNYIHHRLGTSIRASRRERDVLLSHYLSTALFFRQKVETYPKFQLLAAN